MASAPIPAGIAPLPEISVVVPMFNEEANVEPFYRALRPALEALGTSWELVITDDGSADATWTAIVALHARDGRVRAVRLSRNFGHQYALLAGLAHAAGAAVISMDGDLQHPPALIPTLVREWRRGSLVVQTVRRETDAESRFKRVTSRLFYRLFSALSGARFEPGLSDFRLLDRQVLDELLRFGEYGMFLRGLVQWVGYPAARVPFDCGRRHSGTTKYSLRRMLSFAWTAVTSFSLTPLRAAIVLGMLTSTLAFSAIAYAAGARLLGFYTVPGWASAVSIMAFLFGVLFVLLGIIGEYIGKILMEVKQRPRYLVRDLAGTNAAVADRTGATRGMLAPLRPGEDVLSAVSSFGDRSR